MRWEFLAPGPPHRYGMRARTGVSARGFAAGSSRSPLAESPFLPRSGLLEQDWYEGSVDVLPYDDETFDAVICQFGLMFFSSPETALREMARVLKANGRLAVSVFDSLDRQPAYAAMVDVYDRVIDTSAGDAARGPYTMGDTDKLASLFTTAGITTAVITTQEATLRYPSVRYLVLAEVRGWFPFAQIRPDKEAIEAVVHEAERVLEPFRTFDGAVEAPMPIHIITATKT